MLELIKAKREGNRVTNEEYKGIRRVNIEVQKDV